MKRTISIKLNITTDKNIALLELQKRFTHACNLVAEIAEQEKESNRIRLHYLAYYKLRKQFPELGSQMSCNAIAKVAHALTALKKKKKLVFKESSSIHFDKRTYSLKEYILSLFTLQGRIRLALELCLFHIPYLEKGAIKEAELVRRNKRWFFHLVLDIPEAIPMEKGDVMAIDIGENNLAATSTGKLYGGGKVKDQRDKFLAHRRRLQRNGSQSAKQRLRKISGKERRHIKHVNHCIAKELVAEAEEINVKPSHWKTLETYAKGYKPIREYAPDCIAGALMS